MARYEIFENPEARDAYTDADPELLTELGQRVYPALRQDPTNATGWFPIEYDPDLGEYGYRIVTPGGGRYVLRYQAIPEPPRVLVLDLVTVREPGG